MVIVAGINDTSIDLDWLDIDTWFKAVTPSRFDHLASDDLSIFILDFIPVRASSPRR